MGEDVPWPAPPREPGPWNGGPPVAPPGNTPLPPLPGASGTMGGTPATPNPWNQNPVPSVHIPPDRRPPGSPVPGPPPQPPGAPVPAAGSTLKPRAPIALRAVAVIIVLAMVAAGVLLVLKGGRQYPSEWDPKVKDIAEWVAEARELDYEHPVKVNFLTDAEYTEHATAGGDVTDPATAAYYDDQAAQLRALGFISGKVDLASANDTLSDSGTLAYYDPDVEQVFVRGTDMTPALRVTLAHELTHVLQDQHFDLQRMGELPSGEASVLRALAEGDASRIEDTYVDQLSDDDRAAYEEESQASGEDASDELDEKVPPILTTLFASPYILGPQLIDVLDQTGGSKAIDRALQDPPSEEALFDPRTYGTEALAAQPTTVAAPAGAEPIDDGEFGPTTWYLMLAARMDPKVALDATDGWGGDAYAVYRKDDAVCVSISYRGDTEEDVAEMSAALKTWVAASPKGSASATEEDGTIAFESCDPGEDAASAGDVSPDLLAIPVTRTQVYSSSLENATEDQASCFAQGVIDRFTTAQLTDPTGAFVNSEPGQAILNELRQGCAG
ncbi:MAG: hypothetical protein KDA94_00810 [Acidimicrobiales bacterium]|nr:hypothetical protein [Acidimicrobiales bacterium]